MTCPSYPPTVDSGPGDADRTLDSTTDSTTDITPDSSPDRTDSTSTTRCAGCERVTPDGSSCSSCVACDRCRRTVQELETIRTVRGSTICSGCRRTCYWLCDHCEGWNRVGQDCGNGCCDTDCSCWECTDNGDVSAISGLVHSYDYKPTPVFHGTGPLFVGAEIEIYTPSHQHNTCARIAHTRLGELGYLKDDSSIGGGFEIVTHPMSYPWAIGHFPWSMLTELADAGGTATNSTGIHVHLSRAGFASTCHTFRWMKFIHRNRHQVTTLARRSSPDFAAFTDHDRRAVKSFAKGARSHRYSAINTANTDTFELRVFASSLHPAEVQAALGFAAASVEYTRDLDVRAIVRGAGWTWAAFVDWLGERSGYAPLTAQLQALSCVC